MCALKCILRTSSGKFANLKGQSAHFKGKTISALEGLGIELRTLEFDFYTQDWSGREDALTNSATSAAYMEIT